MDYLTIGKQFTNEYYNCNCHDMHNYYSQNAMLTYNDVEYDGYQAIKQLYDSLIICDTKISTVNTQPTHDNKIIILVTGYSMIYNNLLCIYEVSEFTDMIILTLINTNWHICNHIFKTKLSNKKYKSDVTWMT